MSIRVLVADDSPTVRDFLTTTLESDPGIRVVAHAGDGLDAVEKAVELRPDLVLMDVHMPRADGLDATRRIMERAPTPIIVVSGTTRSGDVSLSLSATRAGALIAMAKPGASDGPTRAAFQRELLTMVRAMSQVKVVRRWQAERPVEPAAEAAPPPRPAGARPEVVAIGCSTGGPAALQRILEELREDFTCPILVVQHIAHGFGQGFRDWLAGATRLDVHVARHGEKALPASVYLAPDDHHLGMDDGGRITLTDSPPISGFRPSATCLFRAVAAAAGPRVVAAVLSGMGDDGVAGLVEVKRRGGYVVAQDEASSVVYGMAKEAVDAGLVDRVLPLAQVARHLSQLTRGPRGTP